ncbi:MAG: enoyl-CoA hydratase-related protein [Pseudomonadota bacterium]
MNTQDFKDISYQRDEQGIATLTFNTPKRKNALSIYSFYEVQLAFDAFQQDDAAHALIMTGAPDPESDDPAKQAYSSGGYFSPDAYEGVAPEIMATLDFKDIAQKTTTLKIFQCEKPILAAINGLAIGGAVTLTLAGADQVYMAEHAWLQLPFAKLGICPELASSFLLPRLLGMQKAKEIMFFAEPINAQRAKELNLANEVVPAEKLLEHTYEKALQLVPPRGAPRAVSEIKKLLHTPLVDQLAEALDRENLALGQLFESADFAEALAARKERRAPAFTGA